MASRVGSAEKAINLFSHAQVASLKELAPAPRGIRGTFPIDSERVPYEQLRFHYLWTYGISKAIFSLLFLHSDTGGRISKASFSILNWTGYRID